MTDHTDYHIQGYSEENVENRRMLVLSYLAHGYNNQAELSRILNVPRATINRDVQHIREQAKQNIARFTEQFAHEFNLCLVETNSIQRAAWDLAQNSKYERNKILALSLAKDCVVFKADLITNADVVLRASNFIEIKKDKVRHMLEQEGLDGMNKNIGGPDDMLPANAINSEETEQREVKADEHSEEAVT